MKEIKLTQGKVALVDDQDFDWLNQWKWHAIKGRRTFYAVRAIATKNGQKRIWVHRLILKHTGHKKFIDHIDQNGLNNQRSNLRIAARWQNAGNRFSHIGVSSKYLGVSLGYNHKWVASITHRGRIKYLGLFVNEKQAALSYNAEALKLRGKFARINIIS